jgi:hypothetical protein
MTHFLPDIFPPEISLRGSQPGCETSPRIIRQLGGKRVPEIQSRQASATEDQRQVELGRYLRQVRAGQYWRVANVRSFDEFLERSSRSPDARTAI